VRIAVAEVVWERIELNVDEETNGISWKEEVRV